MKISALLVAVASLLVAVSARVHADDQDYNDGVKQELSQDVQQMYPKRPKADAAAAVAADPQVQPVKTLQVQPAPAQAQIPVVLPTQTQVQQAPQTVTVTATRLQAAPVVAPQAQTQVVAQSQTWAQAPAVAAQTQQPIYILQQPQTAPVAQEQPVTNVEDTPVKEPKIESLRKQREGMERQTEDKLMQKLEDDRVSAEKDRADRIYNTPVPTPSPAAQTAASQPQAVQVPATAAVQADPAPAKTIAAADPADTASVTPVGDPDVVSATTVDNSQSDQNNSSKFTIGALAGIGAYPTVGNISGQYAAGVDVGMELPSRLAIEADGIFSNYQIQDTCVWCGPGSGLVENLNQVNIDGGLNYFILPGKISPVVGVLAGYTRRSYSSVISYGYNGGTTGSSAFDGGLKAGVQVGLSDALAVALDFRYIMNISYHTDNPLTYFGPTTQAPLESLNYYFATLGLRLAF